MNTLEIQTRLKSLGFDPGPLDGDWGRLTMAAVKAFQKARGLEVDGIVGPITAAALGVSVLAVPPWYSIAKSKMGLVETRDKKELMAFLKSDGNTLGDPSKLPWCGDFVQTCVALALPDEALPANPYYALNWMKFGRALSAPHLGAVAVFHRTGGGHVGLVAGHDANYVHVLGGNQSNSVSIARVAKSRLEGYRWPTTYDLPADHMNVTTFDGTITTNEA